MFANWRVVLGLGLVALSVLGYLVHYAIFRDSHHIFIYMVGDIAFVPIEVLLVTLLIHRVLADREKRTMLSKLNMVIGAFFSEVGTRLLGMFHDLERLPEPVLEELESAGRWDAEDFQAMRRRLSGRRYGVSAEPEDLQRLREFLVVRRDFLLRLLENPNLLEHERFSELLWAVFHLTEELAAREDVYDLPESDLAHLSGDIERAYSLLVHEWLQYLDHLRVSYPYLHSLAVRTNPFARRRSPVVAEPARA